MSDRAVEALADGGRLEAARLDLRDDVATALVALPARQSVVMACEGRSREVVTAEPIPAGHKFALRALGAGRRIRKYGEFIGRVTEDVAPGAWVHSHNLVTSAVRAGIDERAWRAQAEPPGGVRVLGNVRCDAGTSPVFDAHDARLYWIDAGAHVVHAYDLRRASAREWPVPDAAQALVLAGDGAPIVATDGGFVRVDPATGTSGCVVAWGTLARTQRCACLQADAQGGLWGAATTTDSRAADGALWRFNEGQGGTRVVERLLTPAGLAWSLDGATLYVAESGRAVIGAYAFDAATGVPGARRTFADLGTMPGELGGMAVDADNHLWTALPGAGCLVRFGPAGSIDRVVRVPVSRPTACAFGGDDFGRLFVTTAGGGGTAARRSEPLAGRVLEMDVGVRGTAPHRARIAAVAP
ncbi:MAG: SMP-30/gluconolactonase/LRE family protein [Betaproteobacteria bacterium]